MIESFLITSRETLEASLIVGIVLSYLSKTDNDKYKKAVYWGIVFGILASIVLALVFTMVAGGFEGRAEEIFEGTTMLIGAALLTTMILWMVKQRQISRHIESSVQEHLQNQNMFSYLGIFFLIGIAILREGVETIIFLNAINFASGLNFIGGLLGVVVAIIVGYVFFLGSKKINLRLVFEISSVLLILFAAGLVAHGIHEFEEAGVVSGIVSPLYDINPAVNADGSFPALHEKGAVGSFFKGLFGYNGNPSLVEVLVYVAYLGVMAFMFLRAEKSEDQSAS